jgi:uncharacterized lipoprotein YbaY
MVTFDRSGHTPGLRTTLAARITKADRLRAIETARHDGRDGLAELLDAKPMRKHKRKQ